MAAQGDGSNGEVFDPECGLVVLVDATGQDEIAQNGHFALDGFFKQHSLCGYLWPFEPDASVGRFEFEIIHGESVGQFRGSLVVQGSFGDQLRVELDNTW